MPYLILHVHVHICGNLNKCSRLLKCASTFVHCAFYRRFPHCSKSASNFVRCAFRRRFSLHGSHLVDALRNFMESFRLPGESPIIARILETFSEHWLVGNEIVWLANHTRFMLVYRFLISTVKFSAHMYMYVIHHYLHVLFINQ